MQTFKRIFTTEVPFWAAAIAVTGITAAASVLYVSFFSTALARYIVPESKLESDALVYGPRPSLSNENFFKSMKDSFVTQGADFIEADLSEMKLRVHQAGAVTKEVPILAKGREGSWWETPAGLYKIETKEKNHFSSFGKVDQPWSMAFQGNFFIHGWPKYPDGTPVSSSYSGGCIRLADQDAEAVYELVKVGTPVLVFEKDFGKDQFAYETRRPDVSGLEYLAADLRNNYVFIDQGSRAAVPVGSLTSLVTGLVSAEYINLDKEIRYDSRIVTAVNVLYPLMMSSSTEAAETLADHVGSRRFVALMNAKVKALGMNETSFSDATGEDQANVSTPEDVFNLLKYVYNNRSFLLKMSTGKLTSSAYGAPVFNDIKNENLIPEMPLEFVGGKFDENEGGESFAGVFDLKVQGETRPVAIIVLGSQDAKADVKKIAEYVVANFK